MTHAGSVLEHYYGILQPFNKPEKLMKHVLRTLCLLFIFCSSIVIADPTETDNRRLWNLQDADILSVINEVSLETGKNFIVDPRVNGKITLISSKPIQANEVYHLFLSILELLGYSAIPSGNVVKIIPNSESSELASPVLSRHAQIKGDGVMVRIFPLEHVSANQMIPIIRPFLPQWSNISAYTPGNVLIIFGRGANLDRIQKIIRQIDVPATSDIDVIPLHQTAAAQLAVVLTNLQNASRASGETPQVSIAPDERSNSLLLSGNKAARLRMRSLIYELDVPNANSEGNTEVIYLKYLKAKEFAPIMGKIAQNILGKDLANAANNNPMPNGTKAGNPNQTSIQAEPNTNALIVTAPPRIMSALHAIVAKLDIRPAQVHIEAVVVELDQDDLKNLGIQWGTLSHDGDFNAALGSGGFLPLGLGSVGIIPSQQVTAILSLLQNTSGANILSTPSIVVLDNQKASLAVGTQITDQTGSYATSGSATTVTPFNTFNRLNVDLKLDVTPQINLGNSVRLGIVLKNDSLKNPDNPGLNPIINTSEIKNSVIVKSGDILVLGGLMSNNITDSTEKIPFLGDIPVVGLLFQHTSRRLEKKNLMIFIKPTILHSAEESVSITNIKYNIIRNAQIDWPEDLMNEGKQKLQNILPPLHNNVKLPIPFDRND